MENRLYRSKSDRIAGGVCAGLANYLKIDVLIIRLLFIVLTLLDGVGLLVYILLWIVIPEEGQVRSTSGASNTINSEEIRGWAENFRDEVSNTVQRPGRRNGIYIGIALVLVGGYILLTNLNIPLLAWVNNNVILAVLVIIVGILLVSVAARRNNHGDQ